MLGADLGELGDLLRAGWPDDGLWAYGRIGGRPLGEAVFFEVICVGANCVLAEFETDLIQALMLC